LCGAAGVAFAADPPPDPMALLQSVRMAQTAQHLTLVGDLRTGPKSMPLKLTIDGSVIRYEFSDPPNDPPALVLRLGDKSSQLQEVTRGKTEKVTGARFDQKVRNSDVSYEDLALRFLYWPEAKLEGEDTLITLGQRCWKVDVQPGATESQYSHVLVWIAGGALLQAEAYDKAGKLARRFKVLKVQKFNGLWVLKEMRIEVPKVNPPTYLDITGEEK
jgi:hypothetical protein